MKKLTQELEFIAEQLAELLAEEPKTEFMLHEALRLIEEAIEQESR